METIIMELSGKYVTAAVPSVIYNSKDITKDISKYLMSLSYTDYEKDRSDELAIKLKDYDNLFVNSWRPAKGDKINVSISYDNKTLPCGTFTVDEVEFDLSSSGSEFTIKALAASINQAVREKNSVSYKNKSLLQIAQEIASKHGYTVSSTTAFNKLSYTAQVNESDLAFLARIAKTYGYIFKLTDTVITFIPDENTENADTAVTVSMSDLTSLNLKDSGVFKYKKCKASYLGANGKTISYTAENSDTTAKDETYKINLKFDTKAQAQKAAEAGLKRSYRTVEGSLNFKTGRCDIAAGLNITLAIGNSFDGVYHITKSTHNLSTDGFTTSAEVEQMS